MTISRLRKKLIISHTAHCSNTQMTVVFLNRQWLFFPLFYHAIKQFQKHVKLKVVYMYYFVKEPIFENTIQALITSTGIRITGYFLLFFQQDVCLLFVTNFVPSNYYFFLCLMLFQQSKYFSSIMATFHSYIPGLIYYTWFQY